MWWGVGGGKWRLYGKAEGIGWVKPWPAGGRVWKWRLLGKVEGIGWAYLRWGWGLGLEREGVGID